MPSDDRDYFRERAEIELEAAMKAGHPEAARAHYLLAGYYLDLAYNPSARCSPPDVAPQEPDDAETMTGRPAFA